MAVFNQFPLFNEQYYLANNPDVAAAVNSGAISSGAEHFTSFGLAEGRTRISAFYNEQTYLTANPDVAAAVASGALRSGLQHFALSGFGEGRTQISLFYNEQNYLAANPDVAAVVTSGGLRSGLQHFLNFGFNENRFGSSFVFFNDQTYLATNPDVAAAVASGGLRSGLQHLVNFGQSEGRLGTFSGTSGNDVITGFGNASQIIGVEPIISADGFVNYGSFGSGEVDTLSGDPGTNTFILGVGSELPNVDPQPLYVDGGNNDFALIQNFNSSSNRDRIQLAGTPNDYNGDVVSGNLNISTSNGDLIAIVAGVTSVSLLSQSPNNGTFLIG